jgi:23S rRNA (adenine-N6)-dimethyltransferase
VKRLVKSHQQHFLKHTGLIAELIGHSTIRPRDTVADIGAGSGAITAVLARRVCQVIAYENEPAAAKKLRNNMRQFKNVEVIEEDFLKSPLPTVPYKVFANIPFSQSSAIVRRLTEAQVAPRAIYLIVQKQFARKLLVESDYFHGALGISIAPWWQARIRRPLRRTDFTPPPAVDTVLLELKPREPALLAPEQRTLFGSFVSRCYADPQFYAKCHAPQGKKPSQLQLSDWITLFL